MSTEIPKEEIETEKAIAFDFLQRVNFILGKMRVSNTGLMETAPAPTENKKKTFVEKVDFPKEGGVLVYYNKMKYPVKGFCYGETVETVDMVKKCAMGILNGFFRALSGNKVKSILLALFFKNQINSIFKNLIGEFDYSISRVLQKEGCYCTSGREIHRAFDVLINKYPNIKEFISLRNIVCMIWEYDDAYRYTFQDVFGELDKEKLKKDIVKELSRVLSLITERELSETPNGRIDETRTAFKFEKIKTLLFILNLQPNTARVIKEFFLEVNLDKIKMDNADRYHASKKPGFNWRYTEPDEEKEEKEISK